MQVVVAKSPEKLNRYISAVKSNKFFIFLLSVLIAGMLSGALAVKGMGDTVDALLNAWFRSFLSFRLSAGFWKIFFNCFLTGFIYMTVIGLSAFGVSGMAVLPCLMFFRGFGTCMLAGFLYRNYSLQGIAFADLIILPSCLVADFLLLYASGKAMELSKRFFDCLRDVSARGVILKPQCVDLLKKILHCTLIFVVVSLAEAAFTVCFIKYFNFA